MTPPGAGDLLAPLFAPFEGGGLSLRNRIVMAPMTRWKSPDQIPGPDVAAYYARRARAQVGLIVTEGTTVDHPVSSYSVRTPAFHGAALDGWRRVVNDVHEAGGKIVPQIWHVGAMRSPGEDYPNPDLPSATPSGLFRPGSKTIAEPLTKAGIQQVIDSHVSAAVSARELGFDGVEIHGAHGYLIDQFLWEALNLREDEYGGDAVGRTRFACELVRAVRAAIGPDFPLILRISQWKQQSYDSRLAETPKLLGEIFQPMADAGVDIFHCSQRRWWEAEFEGSPLNFAGWIRRLTGRPTITVGSVGLNAAMGLGKELGTTVESDRNIAPLAGRIAAGEFDLVAVGRALLADPNWVERIAAGEWDKIVGFDKSALERLY